MSHIFQKGSLSHIKKKQIQFLWVISKKSSVVRVILKKVQLFESFWKQKLSAWSHTKKVQFVESYSKINFWVMFEEQNLWVVLLKGSILGVLFGEKRFSSESQFLKKKKYLSHTQKNLNSLSHVLFFKKSSILWVVFFLRKIFESFFFSKNTILWVISKKVFNSLSRFCESFFFWKNSLSHTQKVQFCVSYLLEKSSIRVIFDKRYSLSHIPKKGSNSLTHFQKIKDLFFEYLFKEKLVIFKNKINSSSYIFYKWSILKIIWKNCSVNHIQKKC